MKIERHRLTLDPEDAFDLTQRDTPNTDRPVRSHEILLIHYGSSRSRQEFLDWFATQGSNVSVHVAITRDGELYQYVPFNRRAWHAGDSEWGGKRWINNYSLGIELECDGNLVRVGGRWTQQWSGRTYEDDEVVTARHKHWPAEEAERGWQFFTSAQLRSAIEVARVVCPAYRIDEIIGHDDVAPGRKVDPGPLFPMQQFRSLVFGRRGD